MARVLCRWTTENGDKVTVKAVSAKEHPFLPDHVVLRSVEGMGDSTHPEVKVSTLVVRKEDILYLMGGTEVPPSARENHDDPVVEEAEAPSGPPPPPPPKRKS